MKKLAFFDFCDTLVSFQTADAFIDYVRQNEGNFYMKFMNTISIVTTKIKLITVLNKLFPYSGFSKKIKLLQLRGLSFEKLDNLAEMYYKALIKPNLIVPVLSEMKRVRQKGYEVCIVSAGYSVYLKYFAKEYNIKHLIATKIKFNRKDSKCLGAISGKDCIHIEKINRINSYFDSQELDYKNSISFSDSISDMPLLSMTGKGVVVSKITSQSWSHLHNFNEIVWT